MEVSVDCIECYEEMNEHSPVQADWVGIGLL